ncbi:MAG: excinuclease ABC subunit A, partial [Bdellovibrionales bacterium]|nr:excinuclease ABC subunit A [Bdellovibrionales bacterium]
MSTSKIAPTGSPVSSKKKLKEIQLWGVKQNNLKNISVNIPLGSMTVVCGPSGSGKSSLAFETLYAEGQRRYIESLSNYTKQFLNKAPKPDVEGINNIPPALALEQKNSVKTSRSTVGTSTEVIDYLRLLYEKMGEAYCPDHHILLEKDDVISGSKKVLQEFTDKRGYILAPIPTENRVLAGRKLYDLLLKEGYQRIYKPAKQVDAKTESKSKKKSTKKALKEDSGPWPTYDKVKVGEVIDLSDPKLRKTVPKDFFYIVIDRLAFTEKDKGRIIDSLSQAFRASLKFNKDSIISRATVITTDGEQLLLSEDFSCSVCGYHFPNITSQLFSFNSPAGACEECKGFGNVLSIDEEKVIPNPQLSIYDGALTPFEMNSAKSDRRTLLAFCKKAKIDVHTPWAQLTASQRKKIWEGTEDFYGVLGLFEYLETKKYKMHVRVFLSRYKSPRTCKVCGGTRLRPEAQQVLLRGHSISDLCALSIKDLIDFFAHLTLSKKELETCKEVYQQIFSRLGFLNDVGVGYLTLDRPTKTLSGGEYQRLSLSNQLGMGLSQTLYVLDE